MSLETPQKIRELQRKLYLKAKQEPTYRFYGLYDKVYRADVLAHAYSLSKANDGAPGVDGQTYVDIEAYGKERFLAELGKELQGRTYRAEAVRRVKIPKPDGGERPLGIPTVKDRVAQTALKLVIEPIFEADFTVNAYAYRPKRDAKMAVREVHRAIKAGYTGVVDADVSKYFDAIPHGPLLRSVARRVSDGAVLHLVKMWLRAPVEERTETGGTTRKGGQNRGTPQGGIVSPLLANIYMRRFLKAWETRESRRKVRTRVVNYADDLVILCRGCAKEALQETRVLFSYLGLTLNEQKTRTCDAWRETFDFLGYTFGGRYAFGSGEKYLAAYPSAKSMRRLKEKLRRMIGSHLNWQSEENVVRDVNRVLSGWLNYFDYGTLWHTYGKLERFIQTRMQSWLVRKHKVDPGSKYRRFSAAYLYGTLGLINVAAVLSPLRRSRATT
jgi:RNA-directed DNA polymerase